MIAGKKEEIRKVLVREKVWFLKKMMKKYKFIKEALGSIEFFMIKKK